MADVREINYQEDNERLQPQIYNEAENFSLLMQSILKTYEDQQKDFLWLYEHILDLDVAENSHLDFIGMIVGQDRFLTNFNVETYFGFEGSYKSDTFSTLSNPSLGGFWNSRGHLNTASSRRLSDDEYRRVIKARVIFNSSDCIHDDLVEVINLITNKTTNRVQTMRHGLIRITSEDDTGLLSYFIDRLSLDDNILPVAYGVRVELAG